MGENAGVVDVGARPGGHVQDRVAQPPVLRRAAPGRGHRGRRHRPRHPDHGRPADRGDGRAALRRGRRRRTPPGCCPAWCPASAATATAWACPTSAASWSFDPSYLANPLVNALCVGVLPADGIKLAKADGPGSKVVLFGARTGGDGIGGASVLARPASRRRGRAQAAGGAGRRPVRREGADRVLPGDLRRRPGHRHPGSRRGRAVLRDHRAGRGRHRRHGRRPGPGPAARRDPGARRDPDERVAGTHDGGGRRRTTSRRSWPSAPSGTSTRP